MNETQAIENNMGMIVKLAKSFKPRDINQLEDYIQLGRIGVMKAVRHFNPDRNTKFETYAWHRIRWEIMGQITSNAKHPARRLPGDIEAPMNTYLWELLPSNLTAIERTVINLRTQGYTFKQIGKELGNYTRGWANKIFRSARTKVIEANET